MGKITTWDQASCRVINAAIKTALAGLEDEYGVKVTVGGGSFSAGVFKPKVQVGVMGEDGTAMTKEAEDFKYYHLRYGLEEDDLFKEFDDVGGQGRFRIIGCKPRSKKYPILVKNLSNGSDYKFPASRVKLSLEATTTEA